MNKKDKLALDWLKRYTGTDPKEFGDWILLTNFQNYVDKFSKKYDSKINGIGGPMTSSVNKDGLSIVNFGIGSAKCCYCYGFTFMHKTKRRSFFRQMWWLEKNH